MCFAPLSVTANLDYNAIRYIMSILLPWLKARPYNYEQILKRIMRQQESLEFSGDNLRHCLREIIQVIEASHGSLFLYDSKEGVFFLKVYDGGKPLNTQVQADYEFVSFLKQYPFVVLKDEIRSNSRYIDIRQAGLHYFTQLSCVAVIPLISNGNWVGLLNIGRRRDGRSYTDSDCSLLKLLGFWLGNHLAHSSLYQDMLKKNQRMAEMQTVQSQLMANVTHELKTPLNGILGLTEILLSGADGLLNDDQRRHLKMVHAAGESLSEIVNNMLSLIRVENDKKDMTIKRINLATMVFEVARIFEEAMHSKDNSFECFIQSSVLVYGDEEKIRNVLMNLLSNATKFTQKGSIEIHAVRSGEMLRVCVKDTGVGVLEAQRESIFEAFHQGDVSLTRSHGGAGLGLTLAKKIVEMHGGRIWVESVEGKGSEFYFTLPLKPALLATSTQGLTH